MDGGVEAHFWWVELHVHGAQCADRAQADGFDLEAVRFLDVAHTQNQMVHRGRRDRTDGGFGHGVHPPINNAGGMINRNRH